MCPKATRRNVVVRVASAERVVGGIVVPATVCDDDCQLATVVDPGPLSREGVAPGDSVAIWPSAGKQFEWGGEEYIVLKEGQVPALVRTDGRVQALTRFIVCEALDEDVTSASGIVLTGEANKRGRARRVRVLSVGPEVEEPLGEGEELLVAGETGNYMPLLGQRPSANLLAQKDYALLARVES